jgi:hypothetical protein
MPPDTVAFTCPLPAALHLIFTESNTNVSADGCVKVAVAEPAQPLLSVTVTL